MSDVPTVRLEDRGVIRVSGEDAGMLLAKLVTNEVGLLETQPAIYAGLLTPQGKIIADFFIVKDQDGFLIDVALEKRAEVIAKLKFYRLRSKAAIDEVQDLAVYAGTAFESDARGVVFDDPRWTGMGQRLITAIALEAGDVALYHAHRISLGVPEGGKDWEFGGAFPHEALFDQLNGVSFTKGCYIGQEIVSRMEHRGTARTRIVQVSGDAPLPDARPDVMAGDVSIGRLGSVAGCQGLALLRIDRVAEFVAKGVAISGGGVALKVSVPAFARFSLAS